MDKMDFGLQSPYCNAYKIPNQQKGLIMQHLIVRKLTRRELEDKYLRIIDENYELKRENNVQKEKIKVLTTKLLRLSKENSKFKSREFLFVDEHNEIQEAEEYFRPRRPASSSAITREFTRNSTPNLSRYKGDLFQRENSFDSGKQAQGNASESAEHSDSKNKDSVDLSSIQMENQIKKLTEERDKLREIGELEKQTNAQLEIQIKELKEKLNGKKLQNDLEASVEIAELTKKIKELQTQLDDAEKCYQKKMVDYDGLLEKERQKIIKSEFLISEAQSRVAIVEKEKADLAIQFEKISSISDDAVNYKKRIADIGKVLEETEKALEKEKSDKASIEHSQEDLLKKMKDLQKENDQLVVKLEGLKTENDGLLNKNKKLEDRIKILEDQNKQQLHQINETLKMPTPLTLDRETTIAKSMKEVQKIEAIVESSKKSVDSKERRNSNSTSTSPTILAIPTVNLSDEKRPATPEKDLKVIPKIVEPSMKLKDDGQSSTITSQTVPSIKHDSPIPNNIKAFAEVFSRSVSKDAPTDDDFDPNTFSIDQHEGRNFIENIGIMNGKDNAPTIERTKNILLEEIRVNRRVRLSFVKQNRNSVISVEQEPPSNVNPDTEKLSDFLKRNSSTHSSNSSIRTSSNRMPSFLLNTLHDKNLLIKHSINVIKIEIASLTLVDDSEFLNVDEPRYLYVEYSFLGYKGHLLETQALPQPMKANEALNYNFKQRFDIKPDNNDKQLKMLKSMLSKNTKEQIKFFVVSEPIGFEEVGCEEVGFAFLKLYDLLEATKNDSELSKVNVYSTTFPHPLVAFLIIKISGLFFFVI